MKPRLKTMIANREQILKASSPKSRDKNRARLKILQVCELLRKESRAA